MAEESIPALLLHHAERAPETLCLADRFHSCTYREAWRRSCSIASQLRAMELPDNAAVLIQCTQTVDFVLAFLGAQIGGYIAVPLEKNASRERIAEIADATQASAYLGKAMPDSLANISFLSIEQPWDEEPANDAESDAFEPSSLPSGSQISEILFSTGTTGKSKGIVITHSNNIAIAENIVQGVEMKPGNVEIIPMPLSHSHGIRTVYANIANGSTSVICDGVIALKLMFNLMDRYQVTAIDLSPSMLAIIFKLSRGKLADYADVIDYVELGSAPLTETDKGELVRTLPRTRLYNFYGSTESGRSCLLDFNANAGKLGCIGAPAANATFFFVDEQRQPVESSPDNPGLLACRGPMTAQGYLGEAALTADTMEGDTLYTKDLGYFGEDGLIYLMGRKDDVINFGGVKIAPDEIESVAVKYPGIEDCACIAVEDKLVGQLPLLCIQLANDAELDEKELKTFLAKRIDQNKQPQRFAIVDEIPRTFNGKIVRRELVERFRSK